MTLANVTAAVGRRARRFNYRRPRPHLTKRNNINYDPKPLGPRGVPAISICVKDLDDQTLLSFGALEDHSARVEILKRHIMDIDHCSYETACDTFHTIAERNMEGHYMVTLPYKIGITSALFAGVSAIPLVFHLPSIEWFNEWAVTSDIPAAEELETSLEVSIWAWNWMEVSHNYHFVLMCNNHILR